MIATVFRPRGTAPRRAESSYPDLIRAALGADDIDLVNLGAEQGKPVLVSLRDSSVIIKPCEAGDERLTYEALYDTCLGLPDLVRMRERGLSKPEPVRRLTRATLRFRLAAWPEVRISLVHLDGENVSAVVNRLLRSDDPRFRETLFQAFADSVAKNGLLDPDLVGSMQSDSDPDPKEYPDGFWDVDENV